MTAAGDGVPTGEDVGAVVTVDPRVRFGRPAVGGVSVESLAEHVWAGEGVDAVAADYDLSREQVLVACWYAGTYGTTSCGRIGFDPTDPHRTGKHVVFGKVWRDRWADWADQQVTAMWHGNWEDVTEPPSEGEAQ